jgi:cell shape-determining protein MreC
MTRYRFDNQEKKEKTSRTKMIVIGFVIIGIVLVAIFLVAPLIKNLARGPEWLRGASEQAIQSGVTALGSKKAVLAENEDLKNKIEGYQAQTLELQMIRNENTKLRAELSYAQSLKNFIGAQILAKPSQSLFNSLVIDQGKDAGIQVGQLVVTQGTIGLGKVVSVTSKTATVELFSGPQFSGDLVMKNQNITVPAIGKGSGNFEIHIPREIKVIDGDILAFPESPDLAIGVVKTIIFDPRDPFQTVLARTPVNVQELRFVEVIQ